MRKPAASLEPPALMATTAPFVSIRVPSVVTPPSVQRAIRCGVVTESVKWVRAPALLTLIGTSTGTATEAPFIRFSGVKGPQPSLAATDGKTLKARPLTDNIAG